jgi:hypothetical protein
LQRADNECFENHEDILAIPEDGSIWGGGG